MKEASSSESGSESDNDEEGICGNNNSDLIFSNSYTITSPL